MSAQKWLENRITIPAGGTYDLQYNTYDLPNSFSITNSNNTEIYVAINRIPTQSNYEFKLSGNTSDVYGSPKQTRNIYFYNPAMQDASLLVHSCFDSNFSIESLKRFSINLEDQVADKIKGDGVVRGFTTSLPLGSNKIGKIEIDNQNFDDANAKIIAMQQDIKDYYKDFLTFKTDFNKLKDILSKQKYYMTSNPDFVNLTTATTLTVYPSQKSIIKFLVNDGENDVLFNYLNDDNYSNQIVIRKNEAIYDLEFVARKDGSNQTYSIASVNGAPFQARLCVQNYVER